MIGNNKIAISCGQIWKCLFIMIACIVCLLWMYLMLSTDDEQSRINLINDLLEPNVHDLDIPAYFLNKDQYYDRYMGYKVNSYLPSKMEMQQLLNHNTEYRIESKYPKFYKLGDLLKHWPSNNTHKYMWKSSPAHPSRGGGLYRLNFMNETERKLAHILRDIAVPYVLYNIPDLDAAARGTFNIDSLLDKFGHHPRVIEQSATNEFTYYTVKNVALTRRRFPDWRPPQRDVSMTFKQFVSEVANAEKVQKNDISGSESLFYMIVGANEGGRTEWIRSSLPMFEPVDSLFMSASVPYRGINCRFGMKGVTATAHYDGHKNYIAMVRGRKRYVLLPPTECSKLDLYPRGHPSARHSKIRWSNSRQLSRRKELYDALATEVVLSMGEMLYLPGYWFHYIISQDASIQCNARSGESKPGREEISKCGFTRRKDGKNDEIEGEEEEEEEEHEEEHEEQSRRDKAKYSMMREKPGHKHHRKPKPRGKKGGKVRHRKPVPVD